MMARSLVRCVEISVLPMLVFCGMLRGEVLVQPEEVDYLIVEAEAYEQDESILEPIYVPNRADAGFIIVTTEPEEFFDQDGESVFLLPEDSNASGGAAIFDQLPGGNFQDSVVWQLQFATAGTYSVYYHYSMFEVWLTADGTYGNEDSFFLPIEWNAPAEQFGRSNLAQQGAVPHDGTFEGNFQWMKATWEDGSPAIYDVGDPEVGRVLDFNLATRERGAALDAMIFSIDEFLTEDDLDALLFGAAPGVLGDFNQDGVLDRTDIDLLSEQSAGGTHPAAYDLNADLLVDDADIRVWVKDLFGSWIGDADLDGEFKSSDLVVMLSAGTYEVDADAVWTTGDFNGDGRTNSADLVAGLSDGGYEQGVRPSMAAVPEPTAALLLAIGSLYCLPRRRASR